MVEIVNLRLARKAKGRVVAEAAAAANRAQFGRTKAERTATAADVARMEHRLDGAKRED